MSHLLLFEGSELTGKSFLMSQLYDWLEKKYNSDPNLLNGCHWLNCDIGILGDRYAGWCLNKLAEMVEPMTDRNIIIEKFHLSDLAYRAFHQLPEISYNELEARLAKRQAKIIFTRINPDPALFEQRLKDRLQLYPHYARIAKTPAQYIKLQELYEHYLQRSQLPSLTIDSSQLPNPELLDQILTWLKEK